jgi:PKHD-type hydroxylase
VAPLPPDDFKPLYERVATAIAAANCRSWGFCLDGFVSLQVLVYGPGDQQGWHHDVASPRAPRCFRLAASILLSRPDEFEGGQLELMLGLERRGDDSLAGPAFPLPLDSRGAGVVYPSFVVHRVTPLTAGRRVVVVARLGGEQLI